MSSNSRVTRSKYLGGVPHAQEDIRDSTMQLSSIPLRSPLSTQDSFIFPSGSNAAHIPSDAAAPLSEQPVPPSIATSLSSSALPAVDEHDSADSGASGTSSSTHTATTTPRGHLGTFHPSGLSLLLARQAEAHAQDESDDEPTPTVGRPRPPDVRSISTRSLAPSVSVSLSVADREPYTRNKGADTTSVQPERDLESDLERAPLLGDIEGSYFSYTANGNGNGRGNGNGNGFSSGQNGHAAPEAVAKRTTRGTLEGWGYRVARYASADSVKGVAAIAVRSLPAVLLGALLNILDGVSCAWCQPVKPRLLRY